MVKTCRNCKHITSTINEEPCWSCTAGSPYERPPSNWTPKPGRTWVRYQWSRFKAWVIRLRD